MRYIFPVFVLAALFLTQSFRVTAQFTVKVPKIPKIEKPKTTDEPATANPPSESSSSKSASRSSGTAVYGPVRRDATPRLIKDSVYVQAVTEKEYWKAPGQSGYHSWAPKVRFHLFYNHEKDLKFTAEYYNPDGSLWFSEPLTIGNAGNDNTNPVQSDRDNTSQILSSKSSVAVGLFAFKIKESITGQTFYEGKFRVGKFLPPNRTKNQFEFYVDHDWEMPIGTVSFHYSSFTNSGDNIGGFEPIVSVWFKGNYDDREHGLEARIFYKGQQIATTANGGGAVEKDSYGGGQRATEQSVFVPDLYHWQKWNFWWKKVLVDNGGTFNRDNFPNAHYIDKNPGEYVVKIYRNGTQVRETAFTVAADGRVADAGYQKPGYLSYYKVIIPVKMIGTPEKWNAAAWTTDAFYGNPMTGFGVR